MPFATSSGPMSPPSKVLLLAAFFAAVWTHDALADKKTVCTITVNSADEKEAFRRTLPPDKYQFVELVERGRPDWLASACRQGVRCDVLVISGHYDGGNEFFSDRLEAREFLPVDEMERVSCSDSCPGLFSQLKEVYLFGCNTLNADAQQERVRRDRAQPRSLRALARRRRAAGAGVERAPRREQPRPHAPDLQGRAGDLRFFVGGAARTDGRLDPAEPLLPAAGTGEIGSGRASGALARRLSPATRWSSTRGLSDADPLRRASAGRLPVRRRPAVAGAEARLHPRLAAARDGGSAHVPRPHRGLRGIARTTASGRRRRSREALDRIARDDTARDALPRFRARRRPARGARPDARARAGPGLAHAGRAAGRARADDRRATVARNAVGAGRSRPRVRAQQGSRARPELDRLQLPAAQSAQGAAGGDAAPAWAAPTDTRACCRR